MYSMAPSARSSSSESAFSPRPRRIALIVARATALKLSARPVPTLKIPET